MRQTIASGKSPRESIEVMVKGFGDCPSHLGVVDANAEVVVVQSLTTDTTLGFRREWVFQWDEVLFSQLDEAYERSDSEALSDLWGRAEPWS